MCDIDDDGADDNLRNWMMIVMKESDIEGSYGTNPNEGKKMYNHR